jgi:hypothetical protein
MRDRETIDSELRLLASVRRTVWVLKGSMPSTDLVDALLDERIQATQETLADPNWSLVGLSG